MSSSTNERCTVKIHEGFLFASGTAFFLFLFFLWIAGNRFLSGDEGFYLYAAKDVLTGDNVYLDFFYPQMPLLPYFYALGMKLLGGVSWESGRFIAALVSAGCGLCVYKLVLDQTSRRTSAALGAAFFALTDFTFFYFPIAKAYSLSALFLLLGLVAAKYVHVRPRLAPFLAGLFIAFSIEVRLYVVLAIPLFIWDFWRTRNDAAEFRKILVYFFIGGVLGSLPSIILFAASPARFWFNNIVYHSMRSRRQFFSDLPHKVAGLGRLVGSGEKGESIQFVMLVFITFISVIAAVFKRKRIPLTTSIGAVLFIGSMLPTPMYLQYYAMVVPFWMVTSVSFATDALYNARNTITAGITGFLLCALFLYSFPENIRRSFFTGKAVAGSPSKHYDISWRLEGARQIAALINSATAENERVASSWPGYLINSHALAWPGLENHFGITVADHITREERQLYRLEPYDKMRGNIEGYDTRLVISGYHDNRDYPLSRKKHSLRELAMMNSYTQIGKVGGARVYLSNNRGGNP